MIQPSVFSYSCVEGLITTMVGNNGTMMAIRIVHSKLRKREEHSASVHPAEVLQAPTAPPPDALAYRQQPLWQFPPPLPPPFVYPHDQVSTITFPFCHSQIVVTQTALLIKEYKLVPAVILDPNVILISQRAQTITHSSQRTHCLDKVSTKTIWKVVSWDWCIVL